MVEPPPWEESRDRRGLEHHAGQGLDVHAGVLVETLVFRGHGGLHQRGGQFLVAHEHPVLYMVCGEDLTLFRNDLGGQLGVRVLQFLDGGYIGKGPDQAQQQQERHDGGDQNDPEPFDDFFLGGLCHLKKWYPYKT